MRTLYTDLNITFSIGNDTFHVLNIVFERFLRSIPRHRHSGYEIHYIAFGCGSVMIGDKTYPLVPNTLYITGPRIEHEQYPDPENPMAEYCIYLKPISKSTTHKKSAESDIAAIFLEKHFWFGEDHEEIHSVMQQIFYELEHKYTGYMTQIETLLRQCIVKVIRNYELKKESLFHFTHSNLGQSKYIIIEESFLYDFRTITLSGLAMHLGLGTRQTERLLKDHYGKTFQQIRLDSKMSAAAILLSDKDSTITSIADKVGYSSVEHFSTAFKHYYGSTPRDYRKNLQFTPKAGILQILPETDKI